MTERVISAQGRVESGENIFSWKQFRVSIESNDFYIDVVSYGQGPDGACYDRFAAVHYAKEEILPILLVDFYAVQPAKHTRQKDRKGFSACSFARFIPLQWL
jgi:hypothetical protein